MENNKWFNIWDYLYYRTTILYSKIDKNAGFEDNKDTGAHIVTVCTMFNFFGIILAIISLIFPKLMDKFRESTYDYVIIIIILLGYAVLITRIMRKRHDMIFQRYRKETAQQRKNRGFWLIIYVIISIISFFASAYLVKYTYEITR